MGCWTVDEEKKVKEFFIDNMTDQETSVLLGKPISEVRLRRYNFDISKKSRLHVNKKKKPSETTDDAMAKLKNALIEEQNHADAIEQTDADSRLVDMAIDSLLRKGVDKTIIAASFLIPLEKIKLRAVMLSEEKEVFFSLP